MKHSRATVVLILFLSLHGFSFAEEKQSQLSPGYYDIDQAEEFYGRQDWENVRKAYSDLVKANPYNGKYWARLGEACVSLKDYNASIDAYKRQLETGYELGTGIFNIAAAHALLNQPEEAVNWLKKLIPLKYWSEMYLLLQLKGDDFKNIRNHPEFLKLMPPKPSPDPPRDEGWRADLKCLAEHLFVEHYSVYNKVSKEQFETSVKNLHERIPGLPDHEIIVEMMKIVAAIGDGHTSLFPPDKGKYPFHQIPVMFYEFKEGLFVRAAPNKYRQAVGRKVVKIGDKTVEEARQLIKTVAPADHELTHRWTGPVYLTIPEVLYNLGMTGDLNKITVELEDEAGTRSLATFDAEPFDLNKRRDKVEDKDWVSARDKAGSPTPLWLKDPNNQYWFEYLPDRRMVYFQFNQILNKGMKIPGMPELDELFKSPDGSTETIAEFCRRLFGFINSHDVEYLVIDLRLNNGGNSFLNQALVHEIIKSEKINQKGRLFTIIGRRTYSACQNLSTDLERETQTILVGEPTGSKPNFIGEDNHLVLPYSGLMGSISNRYHQHSILSDDYRYWIAPDIAAELSIKDYTSNVDPAMTAILDYIDKEKK